MPGAPGVGSAAKVIRPFVPGKVAQAGDAKSTEAMITAPAKTAPSLNDFMSFPFIYAAGLSLSSARLAWNLLFGPRAAARPHDESGATPALGIGELLLGPSSCPANDMIGFPFSAARHASYRCVSRLGLAACPAPPFVRPA